MSVQRILALALFSVGFASNTLNDEQMMVPGNWGMARDGRLGAGRRCAPGMCPMGEWCVPSALPCPPLGASGGTRQFVPTSDYHTPGQAPPQPLPQGGRLVVGSSTDVCRPAAEEPLRHLAVELMDMLRVIKPADMTKSWWTEYPGIFDQVKGLMEGFNDPTAAGLFDNESLWKKGEYTRHLIEAVPGRFSMLVLLWDTGCQSPVHSHGGSFSMVKVLRGKAVEQQYANPCESDRCDVDDFTGPLNLIKDSVYHPGEISLVDDAEGIHAIGAPLGRFASLHFYMPGYTETWSWDEYSLNETIESSKKTRATFQVDSTPWDRCA